MDAGSVGHVHFKAHADPSEQIGRKMAQTTGRASGIMSAVVSAATRVFQSGAEKVGSYVMSEEHAIEPRAKELMERLKGIELNAVNESLLGRFEQGLIQALEGEEAYLIDLSTVSVNEANVWKTSKKMGEGLSLVTSAISAGGMINSVADNAELMKNLEPLKLHAKDINALNAFIKEAMVMRKMQHHVNAEEAHLNEMRVQLESLKNELNENEKIGKAIPQELQDEYNKLVVQCEKKEAEIQTLNIDLAKTALTSFLEKGSDYMEEVKKVFAKGSQAYENASGWIDRFGVIGSTIQVAESVHQAVSSKSTIADAKIIRDSLESFVRQLKVENKKDELVRTMCLLKIDHLNKSIEIMERKVSCEVASALSSALKAGKFGVALSGVATSAVATTPGLNVVAGAALALTSLGAAGLKLHADLVEKGRKGLDLDIKIASQSAKIMAMSCEFESKVIDLKSNEEVIRTLSSKEQTIQKYIQDAQKVLETNPNERAVGIYKSLIRDENKALAEITVKKQQLMEKSEKLRSELHETNKELNNLIAAKHSLKYGQELQQVSDEFTAMSTQDIVQHWNQFEEVLESELGVKLEFEEFLAEQGIPIPDSGACFEAVLDFIRNDEANLAHAA